MSDALGSAKTIVAIDTSNLIWRSVSNETKTLKDRNGRPSGHIFGFYRQLLGLHYQASSLDSVSFVFGMDSHTAKETRRGIYSEYKMNRVGNKDRFEDAFGLPFEEVRRDIYRLISYLPHQKMESPIHECDDLIAALPRNFPKQRVIIASNDRDLWRLLKYPKVSIIGSKGAEVTHQAFKEEFGFDEPDLVLPFKALFGDSSDNIPSLLPRVQKRPIIEGVLKKARHIGEIPALLRSFPGDTKSASNVRSFASDKDFELAYARNLRLVNFLEIPDFHSWVSPFEKGSKSDLVSLLYEFNQASLLNKVPFFV